MASSGAMAWAGMTPRPGAPRRLERRAESCSSVAAFAPPLPPGGSVAASCADASAVASQSTIAATVLDSAGVLEADRFRMVVYGVQVALRLAKLVSAVLVLDALCDLKIELCDATQPR